MPLPPLKPYYKTDDGMVRLYQGDALEVLRKLPSESVHLCVCSPPYYGLRDYGTAKWEGGEAECDHLAPPRGGNRSSNLRARRDATTGFLADDCDSHPRTVQYAKVCGKCGARRIDHQIGHEDTPQAYVTRLVEVFREVRRILVDSGSLYLNIGDTYTGGGRGNYTKGNRNNSGQNPTNVRNRKAFLDGVGLPAGNLLGIPWRVAFALQDDGWTWRSTMPWVKRNSLPESIDSRPNKSTEYVLLFTRGKSYFDMEPVRVTLASSNDPRNRPDYKPKRSVGVGSAGVNDGRIRSSGPTTWNNAGRHFRDSDLWFSSIKGPWGLVWSSSEEEEEIPELHVPGRVPGSAGPCTSEEEQEIPELHGLDVTTKGYRGAHYAVFNTQLIHPLLLMGSSERGCCPRCKAPWWRVLCKSKLKRERPRDYVKRLPGATGTGNSCANSVAGVATNTLGWKPGCHCYGVWLIDKQPVKPGQKQGEDPSAYDLRLERDYLPLLDDWYAQWESIAPVYEELETIPCTILDPFCGSGTTNAVAWELGRVSIGIELNPKYLSENAIPRIEQAQKKL